MIWKETFSSASVFSFWFMANNHLDRSLTQWETCFHRLLSFPQHKRSNPDFPHGSSGNQYEVRSGEVSSLEILCQWNNILLQGENFQVDSHRWWNLVHPQQVCRRHQAEQCSWYIGGKRSHPEGPGQAGEVGPWKPNKVQQGQVQGVALGLGKSQVFIQTGQRISWERPCGEGLGCPGRREAGHKPAVCACSPEDQLCSRLHLKRSGQ